VENAILISCIWLLLLKTIHKTSKGVIQKLQHMKYSILSAMLMAMNMNIDTIKDINNPTNAVHIGYCTKLQY
jgi:hypothetical protein